MCRLIEQEQDLIPQTPKETAERPNALEYTTPRRQNGRNTRFCDFRRIDVISGLPVCQSAAQLPIAPCGRLIGAGKLRL